MNSKYASLFALTVVVGCGGGAQAPLTPASEPQEEHHASKPAAEEASKDIKAPGEAKPGDVSRCTVTGEEIEVTADMPHAEHEGKTYYFCCPGCKKKFEADPSKFTKS
jgi:YHS domain-containing protein